MMRGVAVAGLRPFQGVAAQIKNADIEDVSQLGGGNCSRGLLLDWVTGGRLIEIQTFA